jgi:hypothetical protein
MTLLHAVTLVPRWVPVELLEPDHARPDTSYVVLHTDPDRLSDEALETLFNAWCKRQDDERLLAGDWSEEDMQDFLEYLRGQGYLVPQLPRAGLYQVSFPGPELVAEQKGQQP